MGNIFVGMGNLVSCIRLKTGSVSSVTYRGLFLLAQLQYAGVVKFQE